MQAILPAVEIGTFHTNPKRQRGIELTPSLALRVGVISNRGEYKVRGAQYVLRRDPCRLVRQVKEIPLPEPHLRKMSIPGTGGFIPDSFA